ncbi:MAG TPA: 2Fe-2S iron-sulfur cluster-binding protein [Candidatus Nanoarchaeia archaeon]|nr:2Fe-2S iron-sulfur cluster-binding protein [Candidatus Nanoarchaeia archaeon]
MASITFFESGIRKELPDSSGIKEACEDAGIPFGCKDGLCGTCLVTVIEGRENLSPKNDKENDLLGPAGDERLACQCILKQGNITIKY